MRSSTTSGGAGMHKVDMAAASPGRAPSQISASQQRYETVSIRSLTAGVRGVAIKGKIVNIYQDRSPGRLPPGAAGAISNERPQVCLGHALTLWTTHVQGMPSMNATGSIMSLLITIFPSRDHSCGFHLDSDAGLNHLDDEHPQHPSSDLMTLRTYLHHGHEKLEPQILVCVRAVSARRTVLLITSAICRFDQRPCLTSSSSTLLEVDPPLHEAIWLRNFAATFSKRVSLSTSVPEDVFHVDAIIGSDERVLYTLSQLDDSVRADPATAFVGYVSVVLLGLHLTTLHQRRQLLSGQCARCNLPLLTNYVDTVCKQCNAEVSLRLNPRIIGLVVDESGSIKEGRLLLTDAA
ncbi:hypothetical protein FH972_023335 [Carpinus fangiana]|uniref:Uncharacterized protein n=1 Tax=Carpinus fangiana TaxID=176857 RepID=A0A5N6KV90_9ROSI|nr:hypothetical protein FH972_023335 [Carpinus fangiana]